MRSRPLLRNRGRRRGRFCSEGGGRLDGLNEPCRRRIKVVYSKKTVRQGGKNGEKG